MLNASWMHFGTLKEGPVELCVEHYWSLLREAVHRTLDAKDPFSHNAWHLTLPAVLDRDQSARITAAGFAPGAVWSLTDLFGGVLKHTRPVFLEPIVTMVHGRVLDQDSTLAARLLGSKIPDPKLD